MGKHKSIACLRCGGESKTGRCWQCYLTDVGRRNLGGTPAHLVYEIDVDTGCWIWRGPRKNPTGYGYMKNGEMAHRYSYRVNKGPIPEGKIVMHRCDNPPCVNPDHLTAGTHQDNMADKKNKGRACWGERNPRARLTQSQVREIYRSEDNSKALADRYGVHVTHINRIKRGAKWARVTTQLFKLGAFDFASP